MRNQKMLTKNVTQYALNNDNFSSCSSSILITLENTFIEDKILCSTLFWHKLKNSEYWSIDHICTDILFVVYYIIKFRSFSFYKYSNPVLKNEDFLETGNLIFISFYLKVLFQNNFNKSKQ
jgi:hypothetical protein